MRQRMEHPRLPGQPIYVRQAAVAAYRRGGWREAPEPPVEPEQQEQEQPRKARRSRVTQQQEESHGAEPAQ